MIYINKENIFCIHMLYIYTTLYVHVYYTTCLLPNVRTIIHSMYHSHILENASLTAQVLKPHAELACTKHRWYMSHSDIIPSPSPLCQVRLCIKYILLITKIAHFLK